jgi:hypothetical protein
MSPEQVAARAAGNEQPDPDGKAGFRNDVYSLGCTFYAVLTGEPPTPGADPDTLPFPPNIPAGLEVIVRNMLSLDPFLRPTALQAASTPLILRSICKSLCSASMRKHYQLALHTFTQIMQGAMRVQTLFQDRHRFHRECAENFRPQMIRLGIPSLKHAKAIDEALPPAQIRAELAERLARYAAIAATNAPIAKKAEAAHVNRIQGSGASEEAGRGVAATAMAGADTELEQEMQELQDGMAVLCGDAAGEEEHHEEGETGQAAAGAPSAAASSALASEICIGTTSFGSGAAPQRREVDAAALNAAILLHSVKAQEASAAILGVMPVIDALSWARFRGSDTLGSGGLLLLPEDEGGIVTATLSSSTAAAPVPAGAFFAPGMLESPPHARPLHSSAGSPHGSPARGSSAAAALVSGLDDSDPLGVLSGKMVTWSLHSAGSAAPAAVPAAAHVPGASAASPLALPDSTAPAPQADDSAGDALAAAVAQIVTPLRRAPRGTAAVAADASAAGGGIAARSTGKRRARSSPPDLPVSSLAAAAGSGSLSTRKPRRPPRVMSGDLALRQLKAIRALFRAMYQAADLFTAESTLEGAGGWGWAAAHAATLASPQTHAADTVTVATGSGCTAHACAASANARPSPLSIEKPLPPISPKAAGPKWVEGIAALETLMADAFGNAVRSKREHGEAFGPRHAKTLVMQTLCEWNGTVTTNSRGVKTDSTRHRYYGLRFSGLPLPVDTDVCQF